MCNFWSRSQRFSEYPGQLCDLETMCERLLVGFILGYKGSRRLQKDGDEYKVFQEHKI